MKHLSVLGWLAIWGASCAWRGDAAAVIYLAGKALGVPVQVIKVNLRDPNVRVTPAVCYNFLHGTEEFASLVARTVPRAAVTGTFFNPATSQPVGDIVIRGKRLCWGGRGTALCIRPSGEAEIRRVPRREKVDWGAYESVLCGGPKLLTAGQIDLRPQAEGFRDPRVLGKATRIAVGLTPQQELLLVAVTQPVSLTELAAILQRLGCTEAMNLDGGTSSGLYYDGEFLVEPKRPLTNVLLVFDQPEAYKRAWAQLVPRGEASAFWAQRPTTSPRPLRTSSSRPMLQLQRALTITNPPHGAVLSAPTKVKVKLQKVERRAFVVFYVDGQFRCASNVAPYEMQFDPARYGPGEHVIEVRLFTSGWVPVERAEIKVRVVEPPIPPATSDRD